MASLLALALLAASASATALRPVHLPRDPPRARIQRIGAHRRLTVGTRRQVPHAGGRRSGHQPGAGDRGAAATPRRIRRHLEPRVLGEHGEDRADVARLAGVDEALHDRADPLVPERARRGELTRLRDAFVDRLAGALQRAVDRRRAGAQQLGDLVSREAENLAQDEHRALASREVLQGRDEGQLERFALLVTSLRRSVAVLDGDLVVGVRRHPVAVRQRRAVILAGRQPVPVSDIDRAKAFYVEKLGFNADHDVRPAEAVRVVQLTPPGSGCSIVLGSGLPDIEMPPGSLRGLHLVVADIEAAREALAGRGVAVSGVTDQGGIKYVMFADPDGNTWALQQVP